MEVTKNNFEEIFPEIVKDIESATFLCIDGEFTGLNNGLNVTAFDTPAESYRKIRAGSLDFLFVQFGLSIFTQDQKTGRYKNKTYVFYLFPRPLSRTAPDARFLCQTSCIDFLVSNNFDFNKLFREGIPYLNATDESSLAESMEVKRNYKASQQKDSPYQVIPVPKQYKPIVDSAMKKIEKVVKGSESEVKLDKCSAFVRKLIYQTYEERFKNCEGIILKSENGAMVCRRGEEEQQEEKDAKTLAAAVGFSRVIREISSRGKLIVGHNMLLDLCHLTHRFLDPLPSDYQLFKEMVHSLFPKIIDTKLISSEEPLKELLVTTTLEGLVETISKPPFHLPQIDETEGYCYGAGNSQYHDAGYDAFVTGKIFLSLVRALDPDNKKCCITNCRPIEKFINKLFLMKAPDTCIDLANSDPEPRRDHVFHISFPSSWTGANILKLFSPFGCVQLYWLSDTSAWVSLHDRNEGPKAKQSLQDTTNLPAGVTVISYYRYMQEKGAATSPRPNKRKSVELESTLIAEKRRRSSSLNEHRNGSMRRISPIPEESPTEDKSLMEESGISVLEEAASFGSGEFGSNTNWD